MRPLYDGVKFYSREDWGIGPMMKKAEAVLLSFDNNKNYVDINQVIELYNIQQLFDTGITVKNWSEAQYEKYMQITDQFQKVLGVFFSKVDENSIFSAYETVSVLYLDDFWTLFEKYKVYNRISDSSFDKFVRSADVSLYRILKHPDVVKHYDAVLAEIMRSSLQAAPILCAQYLENNTVHYIIPASLLTQEYEAIFEKYVDSHNASANVLLLIYKSKSTGKCPISDKLRLKAKHEYKRFWEERAVNVVDTGCGIATGFAKQEQLKSLNRDGDDFSITYDIKWFEENLDYPTILNNFAYIFEMFDYCWRSTLVSVKSKISAVEDIIRVKGKQFYEKGYQFDALAILSTAQTALYFDFLKNHGIDLEVVFKWFFETYLAEEFGATGFSMIASSPHSSYAERCRNLAGEMDSVLKQFRMYVRDGEINRELYEMSSEQMIIGEIPSLLRGKYVYVSSDELQNEINCLFSDQTILSFTERTKADYPTLFELLKSEEILYTDFYDYQLPTIDWLINRGALNRGEDGRISIAKSKVLLLRDLYRNEVSSKYWMPNRASVFDKLICAGDICGGDTLFSIPERDYLNYMLNKSQFSNGYDLRNKYIHGSYPLTEMEQKSDYIQLLKLMVLVVTKINDDFCLKDKTLNA